MKVLVFKSIALFDAQFPKDRHEEDLIDIDWGYRIVENVTQLVGLVLIQHCARLSSPSIYLNYGIPRVAVIEASMDNLAQQCLLAGYQLAARLGDSSTSASQLSQRLCYYSSISYSPYWITVPQHRIRAEFRAVDDFVLQSQQATNRWLKDSADEFQNEFFLDLFQDFSAQSWLGKVQRVDIVKFANLLSKSGYQLNN